jgi:hypothetical protein
LFRYPRNTDADGPWETGAGDTSFTRESLFFPQPLLSQALDRREMAIATAVLTLHRPRGGIADDHLAVALSMPPLPARKGPVALSEFFEE